MLIMRPHLFFAISFAARWAQKNSPFKLISTVLYQSASVSSSAGFGENMPALFTKISKRPNFLTISSKTLSTSSFLETSILKHAASRLLPDLISFTTASHSAKSISVTTTLAPCDAKAKAWDLPIPLRAPVTSATLFFKSNMRLVYKNYSDQRIDRVDERNPKDNADYRRHIMRFAEMHHRKKLVHLIGESRPLFSVFPIRQS